MRTSTEVKFHTGRPPSYDRQEAMAAIIDTFRLRGYAGTSLDDIAVATGMKRPSLYAAFGNKKAMYLSAMDAFAERMMEELKATTHPEVTDLIGLMVPFFDRAIDLYTDGEARGCLVLCTAPAEAATDAEVRAKLVAVLAVIEAEIDRRVRVAAQAGLGATEASVLTQVYIAQFTTLALQARSGVPAARLRDNVRALVAATVTATAA